jgi:rRNA maturation endonuclease Nob1
MPRESLPPRPDAQVARLYCGEMSIERTVLPGADFPLSVKEAARTRAAFKCCYCRDRMGDDVHHLTPKEEGGQGVIENAILLCAQCHRDYGDRRDKRPTLRQARDDWHELVARRQQSPDTIAMLAAVQDLATKNDVSNLMGRIIQLTETLKANVATGITTAPELANVASTMVNSISPQSVFTGFAPGTWAKGVLATICERCKTALPPDAAFCPGCGSRVDSRRSA